MERELKTATRNKMKNSVMNALVESSDVSIPKALVETEIANLKSQAIQQMGVVPAQTPLYYLMICSVSRQRKELSLVF